ncbi:hypothetical protein D7V83_00740 [bacterium 0.1xD8-71]|nr:hypothetical protein D7V83_00740 [bacterium 0.1xD8-71]
MNQESGRKSEQGRMAAELWEEEIAETICMAKAAFYRAEQERVLSYRDFLWIQLKIMPKRWWFFQVLILSILGIVIKTMPYKDLAARSMGVASALFVILMIPELWKNRAHACMEIEAASYYSLKQIYAARMLLFGLMDIFLITVFCGAVSTGLDWELSELMIQFLFPLCVTACICFGILCSKYHFSETAAVIACIVWSAGWLMIVLDEGLYERLTVPVWSVLMGAAVLFLAFVIYRILKNCNNYLEVVRDENGTG